MAKHNNLNSLFTGIADAIRGKTGTTDPIVADDFPEAIAGISTGSGGSAPVSEKDVNFYDYDGTLLHSYTVAEAQALSELPVLPAREGLICQGWNWSLEDIKAHNRAVNVGATYITDDGTTRIYITLQEGRTSPMLGISVDGTVMVDWGDGTEGDVLTGTSSYTMLFTPAHEYANPGDYVIRLAVNGSCWIRGGTRHSYLLVGDTSDSYSNIVYNNTVKKIEIGNGVYSIGPYALYKCMSLETITVSESIQYIEGSAFNNCCSLSFVVFPKAVTSSYERVFYQCYSLVSVSFSKSVNSIGTRAFDTCCSLSSITIPEGVTGISEYAFMGCRSLETVRIPKTVTDIMQHAFDNCSSLSNIDMAKCDISTVPDWFCSSSCPTSISIPNGVTFIGNGAFNKCYGVRYYDFSNHTVVPTLSNTNAFSDIPADCEIRVPTALYDEWIAATNWSAYAANIVAV